MTDVADAPAISPGLQDSYSHGLRELRRLQAEQRQVIAAMIRAELEERDRQLASQAGELEARVHAAAPAILAEQEAADHLAGEVMASQQELDALAAVDVAALDRQARREHRLRLAILADDLGQLREEAATAAEAARRAGESVNPLLAEIRQIDRARAVLAEGMPDPLGSVTGQQTFGYRAYLGFGSSALSPLLDGDPSHLHYRPAYDYLMGLLDRSGIGATIEKRLVAYYDEKASPVKHTADGVPFVPHGLTPEEAQLIASRSATRIQSGRDIGGTRTVEEHAIHIANPPLPVIRPGVP
jgi:hypothetical protein